MNATNIVRDGKWYLLLFDEYVKFLVEKTNYDVYMISYDKPMIKVTKDNFQKLSDNVKTFTDRRVMGDCFVMELELPPMKVEVVYDGNPRVTFNSHFNTGLQGHVLDLPERWKNKEVEKEWGNNRGVDLIQLREELGEKIVKYNNGDI